MTSLARHLYEGARPKTLPASLGPVLIGGGLARLHASFSLPRTLLAAAVALALQIGANYANDYSDGIRGTDEERVGPRRLVAGGLVAPSTVKRAALGAFALAGVLGFWIVALTHWWLIIFGAASILAAWYYTGGKKPYGYYGYGELFVFVFFGLVETVGTEFIQSNRVGVVDILAGCSIGMLITAILVANNLRDIPGDTLSGKRTLAVILGDKRTRLFYLVLVVGAFVVDIPSFLVYPGSLVVLLALPLAWPPLHRTVKGASGPGLIPVLVQSGRLVLVTSVLLGAGFATTHGF